jgi:hypothetical protein
VSVEQASVTPRRRSIRVRTGVLLLAAGWLVALGWRWLGDQTGIGFGPFGNTLFRVLVGFALLLSVPLVRYAWSRPHWVVGGLTLLLVAGLSIVGGLLCFSANNVAGWYQLHRSNFVAVGQLVDSGVLGDGADRPGSYSSSSVIGGVLFLGTNNGKPIAYLPVSTGNPDCSAGYAWFSGLVENRPLDNGFGCAVRPVQPLGDGWWFLE